MRQSKYEPIAGEVDLIKANLQYAQVCLADGIETTVSTKWLVPAGNISSENIIAQQPPSSEISVNKMNQSHIPEISDREIVDHSITPPAVGEILLCRSEQFFKSSNVTRLIINHMIKKLIHIGSIQGGVNVVKWKLTFQTLFRFVYETDLRSYQTKLIPFVISYLSPFWCLF